MNSAANTPRPWIGLLSRYVLTSSMFRHRGEFSACHRSAPAALGRRVDLCGRLAFGLQALVEISADRSEQSFHLAVKEMIGALHNFLLDHDALLGLELVDQRGDVLMRHDRILVAVDDEA